MTTHRGKDDHVYGRKRPSAGGNFPVHLAPERDTHFRPLPPPTGPDPFHLDLKDIIADDHYRALVEDQKMTCHINGDMGGIKYGVPQELVAKGMEQDFDPKARPSANPAFLYITGDCVYFNGEINQYYTQFYEPYTFYNGPIFAVPGNHDGENLQDGDTLDGFLRNFCAAQPAKQPESGDSQRTAMTQPNVYWTLMTPLANFVGLYSNVPEGGEIRPPQTDWLVNELKTLPTNRPLLLTLHHPIYSADDHHSGSTYMKEVVEAASQAAGRRPHMIFAGHVHNYQRITKNEPDGAILPHIVTGAGGYHNLHHIMHVDGEKMIPPVDFTNKDNDSDVVTLEKYCDDHHGFLRLEITSELVTGRYYTVPRPQEPWSTGNQLIDYFEFDWKNRRYRPNTLRQSAGDQHPGLRPRKHGHPGVGKMV
jgi:hypothetical protein